MLGVPVLVKTATESETAVKVVTETWRSNARRFQYGDWGLGQGQGKRRSRPRAKPHQCHSGEVFDQASPVTFYEGVQ